MSGGGGQTQTTNTAAQPYSQAIPYLNTALSRVSTASNAAPSYWGGPLTVGPTNAETKAWRTQAGADQQIYGQPGAQLNFGDVAGSLNNQLSGGNFNSLDPISQNAGSTVSGIFNGQNAPAIGRYGFDTSIDPNAAAPQYGVAGNLDATDALKAQLSGQPDYAGVQGAVDAANAPLLRSFQNDLLPSLNSRATFLNNPTGGYKTLATAIPDLGQRMSENALQITNAERLRALQSRDTAAAQIGQGGLQSYGLGLQQQTAQNQAGQALAGQNLSTDVAGANANSNFMNNYLGYGNLASGIASGANEAAGRGLALAPQAYDLGNKPVADAFNYGNYDRTLQEQNLTAQQQKFNYLRDQPQTQAGWYADQIARLSGLGGSTSSTATTTPNSGGAAGALGGALGGAAAGSSFGPWGTAIGAGVGGLLGLF